MAIILIIVSVIIVMGFIILSLYTSVNSGASKFNRWIESIFNEDKDEKP